MSERGWRFPTRDDVDKAANLKEGQMVGNDAGEGMDAPGVVIGAPIEGMEGFTHLRDVYFAADKAYAGRYTVPVLWDKKENTIVSNESSEIIRMFYNEVGHLGVYMK